MLTFMNQDSRFKLQANQVRPCKETNAYLEESRSSCHIRKKDCPGEVPVVVSDILDTALFEILMMLPSPLLYPSRIVWSC